MFNRILNQPSKHKTFKTSKRGKASGRYGSVQTIYYRENDKDEKTNVSKEEYEAACRATAGRPSDIYKTTLYHENA